MRFFTCFLLALFLISCDNQHRGLEPERSPEEIRTRPNDHLFFQRSYPDTVFNVPAFLSEIRKTQQREVTKNHLTKRSGHTWVTQGPANPGARINTLAVDPVNPSTMYLGFSTGGIYKSVDGGASWDPVFDQFPFLAIGSLTINPHHPNEVFAGTGDPNISGNPFIGDGLYLSTDKGLTWKKVGLSEVGVISKVIVDPVNEDVLYVAAMGIPYYRDENRGVYKSTDGGTTWKKVLYLGHMTGVIDLVIDPSNPQTLYAAGWDRIRNYEESITSGPGAKIYKTTDGGSEWVPLESGLPSGTYSRIGLAMSPSNPDRLYAVYVGTDLELHGVYTTTDGGSTWSNLPTGNKSGLGRNTFGGFGWYFGKIAVHPTNEDEIYLLGVRLWRWNAQDNEWQIADESKIGEVHADMHVLQFLDNERFLLGTDGGLYSTHDKGEIWIDQDNIPTTQVYHVSYNPHKPDMYFMGAQDNGSMYGNRDEMNSWEPYFGGDGFRSLFHPIDSMFWYVEIQNGGLVYTKDGGSSYQSATRGIDRNDKVNWDAPVIMSQYHPDILYYGTDRVYRSSGGTEIQFQAISPDLTDEIVLLDLTSNVTALSESPHQEGLLLAGTGDGNLWLGRTHKEEWTDITGNLPDRYITSVRFASVDSNVLFVTHSGYKAGESIPHIHRSDDLGNSWINISVNLPDLPINDILILPNNNDQVLFTATDAGVYYTRDGGLTWDRLGSNMPYVPVFDLEYHPVNDEIIAGTFGKSVMTYALDQEGISGMESTSVSEPPVEQIQVFPNPANEVVHFRLPGLTDPAYSVQVFDDMGRVVIEEHGNEQHALDIGHLPVGIYYLKLVQSGIYYTARFIKQ